MTDTRLSNIDHLISRTVLALPKKKDKTELIRNWLRKARLHRKKWPEPEGAVAIYNLHFKVHSFGRNSFHADATLEVPLDSTTMLYTSVTGGCKTEASALRIVIGKIEDSSWFHEMKAKGVYFRVTGAGMEKLYRGYL